VTVSADGESWFLINASPDLRAQIEAFPGLQPSPRTPRNTPIEAVLLTNADLDHVLGLFLLRETGRLRIHAPGPVIQVLAHDLRLADILKPFCRIDWHEPPTDAFTSLLTQRDGTSGLQYRAIPLSAKPPPFAVNASKEGTQSVAYEIMDERTKGRLVVAPDVAAITPELLLALESADGVLLDGTFWSNDEFQKLTGKSRTADDMGHLVIEKGSLNVLRKVKARHKIYFHINNTNPILDPGSGERAEVERAGVVVGQDGLEFEL
jgi:pyrroloquinoline quinone biosynthesis protein B